MLVISPSMYIQFTLKSLPRKEDLQFIINSLACLTIVPQRVLHTMQPSASFSHFQYPLVSLRSSSCLRLLLRLLVTSSQ